MVSENVFMGPSKNEKNTVLCVRGCNVPPRTSPHNNKKVYVEVLTTGIYECDRIQKRDPCRCNQVKMTSLGWALTRDGVIRRGKSHLKIETGRETPHEAEAEAGVMQP